MTCLIKNGKYYTEDGQESLLYKDLIEKFSEAEANKLFLLSHTDTFKDSVKSLPSNSFYKNGEIKVNEIIRYVDNNFSNTEPLTEDEVLQLSTINNADIETSEDLLDLLTEIFYKDGYFNPDVKKMKKLYSEAEIVEILESADLQSQIKDTVERLRHTEIFDIYENKIDKDYSYKSIEKNIIGQGILNNPHIERQESETEGMEAIIEVDEEGKEVYDKLIYDNAVKEVKEPKIFDAVVAIINAPETVDTSKVENKVSKWLLDYGIDVKNLDRDDYPTLLNYLQDQTNEDATIALEEALGFKRSPKKQLIKKEQEPNKNLVYLRTTKTEQQLFDELSLIKTNTPNVYHKVNKVEEETVREALNNQDLTIPEYELYKEYYGYGFKAEMNKIKEQSVAEGTFMKAPNGQKSNLSEDNWLLTRTAAFKNWFGDWINDPQNASKVVDENGEPMVVYHGSKTRFTQFDKKRAGTNTKMFDKLFYFSENRETSLSPLYVDYEDGTKEYNNLKIKVKEELNKIVNYIANKVNKSKKEVFYTLSDSQILNKDASYEENVEFYISVLEDTYAEIGGKNIINDRVRSQNILNILKLFKSVNLVEDLVGIKYEDLPTTKAYIEYNNINPITNWREEDDFIMYEYFPKNYKSIIEELYSLSKNIPLKEGSNASSYFLNIKNIFKSEEDLFQEDFDVKIEDGKYDGGKKENVSDGGLENTTVYAVWNPTQIKSAENIRLQIQEESNDIRYFKKPTISQKVNTNIETDVDYLQNEFIADFAAEKLKKPNSEFYQQFKITDAGIELISNDELTLAKVKSTIKNHPQLQDYSLISKNLPNLKETKTDKVYLKNDRRIEAVNNKEAIPTPKTEIEIIDDQFIKAPNETAEWIKIGNEIFEQIEEGIYSKLNFQENPNYYTFNVEAPAFKLFDLKQERPKAESKIKKMIDKEADQDNFGCL